MKATIKIDSKKKFRIDTSMSWLTIYRDTFGHDILPDILPAIDAILNLMSDLLNDNEIDIDAIEEKMYELELDTINNVIWALAKNADENLPDVDEWKKSQDTFPLDEIMPQVFLTLAKTYMTTKKLKPLKEMWEAHLSRLTKYLSQGSTED